MIRKRNRLGGTLLKLFTLELLRNKQGIAFLICVPVVFFGAALYTSNNYKLPIKIYNFTETIRLVLTQKEILLLYITAAVTGFLCAYYAMVLFQDSLPYFSYCSFMGMPLMTYLSMRILFFLLIVLILSFINCLVLSLLIPIKHIVLVYGGYLLMGLIYGLYGALAGVVSKNFLHSLLMIIMLTNLDVGWLQNPVFYSYADNTLFIRFLPAFFPCQFIFTSAYTDKINYWCGALAIVYSFILCALLLFFLQKKMHPGPKRSYNT